MKNGNRYNPKKVEAKWSKIWDENHAFKVDIKTAKKPYYNLAMFPYPSGEGLHMGHIIPYSGVDTYGRYLRANGVDVFEPMGFDAFGIHSENYAIKKGIHPQKLIARTTTYFREKQMKRLGTLFDWEREVNTTDPDYYKWTQWIFIQMFKHGLAEKRKAPVTYCPSCKTVLSDEQTVVKNGETVCERCNTPVTRKELEQWFFKITDYADRLLSNLTHLAPDAYGKKGVSEYDRTHGINWSEKTKHAQIEWIGKSEGALFKYKVKDLDIHFEMFDSVPQTFMAQTFTVIAPEHPKVYELVKGTEFEKPVMEFVEKIKEKKASKKFDIEKETEGIFTGRFIEYTPANRLLPIWIASFVIAEYGTGVVNCSAHDERDFIFAKKYNLPLHPVMFPQDPVEAEKVKNLEYCYHHAQDGVLTEPVIFKGRKWGEVRDEILSFIEKNGWGKKTAQFHLRDWCISRQRYWGPPIPMIYCAKCAEKKIVWFSSNCHPEEQSDEGSLANASSNKLRDSSPCYAGIGMTNNTMSGWFPVPESDLPVLLPFIKDYQPLGEGKSPLARDKKWMKVKCPKCGADAERETDVSDTFLDSAWYFLRYPSMDNEVSKYQSSKVLKGRNKTSLIPKYLNTLIQNVPFDSQITKKWLPVDMYIGGHEHAVLHLMYARFVTMALKDMGYIDFEEPFIRFFAHGLMTSEGSKMSKSRGNVVNPNEYIDKYGSDTLRMYILFMGPYDAGSDFRMTGIAGMHRFVSRIWNLVTKFPLTPPQPLNPSDEQALMAIMHKTIKKVGEDISILHFNTAISALMEYYNYLNLTAQRFAQLPQTPKTPEVDNAWQQAIKTLLLLLSPFAPFITEELWKRIADSGKRIDEKNSLNAKRYTLNAFSIHSQPWPKYDPKFLVSEEVVIVIQVNGKVRDKFTVGKNDANNEEKVTKLALSSEKIKPYVSSNSPLARRSLGEGGNSPKPPNSPKNVIFVPGKLINFVV